MSSDDTPPGYGWTSPGVGADPPPLPSYPQSPYGWQPSDASRPGLIPLRPLTVGELLDGGFALIRRYPIPALGLTALLMLGVQVIHVVVAYLSLHGVTNDVAAAVRHDSTLISDSDYVTRSAVSTGVVGLVSFIASLLVTGIITTIVGRGVLGRPLTAGDTWRRTRPVLARLLGVSLLVPLLVLLVVAACLLPGIVVLVTVGGAGGAFLLAVGGIAAFGLALYLVIGWEFAAPVVVLEKAPVLTALSRSRTLVRGSWWRVFGIVLLTMVIAGVVGLIIQLPFVLASGIGNGLLSNQSSQPLTFVPLLLSSIGAFLGATVVRPFTTGVVALLYVDRRMRAEALDLTLAQAAGADS